jgi:hypothetical protein
MKKHLAAIVATLVAPLVAAGLVATSVAAQDAPSPEQRVAALKQSLQENQTRLRQYEWIETTIISLKGEEKARKQARCYYGADGKVQKTPIGEAAPAQSAPQPARGRSGGRVKAAVIENKKSDMQEYMESAAGLIHQYVPPNPAQIQKVKDAGKLSIKPVDGGRVRLELNDYLLQGDRFTVDINAAANSLAGVNVASYLNTKDDVVALDVRFAALPDSTSYAAETILDAKAKNIRVVIQNSGYRPLAQ